LATLSQPQKKSEKHNMSYNILDIATVTFYTFQLFKPGVGVPIQKENIYTDLSGVAIWGFHDEKDYH
jgi:hypothetical protein